MIPLPFRRKLPVRRNLDDFLGGNNSSEEKSPVLEKPRCGMSPVAKTSAEENREINI
jgi:hypothetical protein